jgi:hypothetical protein
VGGGGAGGGGGRGGAGRLRALAPGRMAVPPRLEPGAPRAATAHPVGARRRPHRRAPVLAGRLGARRADRTLRARMAPDRRRAVRRRAVGWCTGRGAAHAAGRHRAAVRREPVRVRPGLRRARRLPARLLPLAPRRPVAAARRGGRRGGRPPAPRAVDHSAGRPRPPLRLAGGRRLRGDDRHPAVAPDRRLAGRTGGGGCGRQRLPGAARHRPAAAGGGGRRRPGRLPHHRRRPRRPRRQRRRAPRVLAPGDPAAEGRRAGVAAVLGRRRGGRRDGGGPGLAHRRANQAPGRGPLASSSP